MRYMWMFAALLLNLSACGGPASKPASDGPRLTASLTATWAAAAPARQALFSHGGQLLATSDASGLITIRNTRTWQIKAQFRHPKGATSLAFGPTDTMLFSGGYDGTVRQWDLTTSATIRVFTGPAGTVWTLDVSPDGKLLAASGEDTVIHIWHLDASRASARLRGHTRNVWDVRFSPDGSELASGGFDDTARLWDVRSGKLLHLLAGHSEAVVGVAFNLDGKILATGGDDSTIRLWRVADGAQLRVINAGKPVDDVSFSRDGAWLASGGHARGAIGTLWHQLTGSGSDGPAVHLWRTRDAALVATLPHPDDVVFVAFSPDGRWLVTSAEDSRFRLWRVRITGG
jgi:WD40 repeat protein